MKKTSVFSVLVKNMALILILYRQLNLLSGCFSFIFISLLNDIIWSWECDGF